MINYDGMELCFENWVETLWDNNEMWRVIDGGEYEDNCKVFYKWEDKCYAKNLGLEKARKLILRAWRRYSFKMEE